ncbi:NAD(P)-dependent alcohol dehydrogenase [Gordonia desulfuricans]|uniref:NAD(P)-dependent alcohol dehydrogenase n=1 Tax=Gordonia desulfuricans TaxID=89051 RepID=A0A7K3LLM5_9ACTN|nr:NAD(P)-dependent alcohol dehydrogenase [Gordonia desulfuricans]NDK89149.1 NAD(P)-dependent alcohol dehydrogenase [Gordonia desulfuricans]
MKSTAALLTGVGSDFEIAEIDIDGPRPGEVLVEIAAAGLCHTDLAARDGVLPIEYPGVVGHEGAGTVIAIGEGVTKVGVGDRVSLTFNSCGHCHTCTTGRQSYCENFNLKNYGGVRDDGSKPLHQDGRPVGGMFFGQSSFATVALANERNTVKIDADIPFEMLAPLGCGIQTGVGAVTRSLKAQKGSTIAIAGGGSVGLAAVMGAVLAECATIIVVEPNERRRALALELGATHALDPAAGDVTEQIRVIVARGVDHVLDTTGIPAVVTALIGATAVRGSVGLIGVPSDATAAIELNIIAVLTLGLTVMGIIEGDSTPDEFIPELVEHHLAGRLPLEKLVTTFPFAEINSAVKVQHDGGVVKPVLMFD